MKKSQTTMSHRARLPLCVVVALFCFCAPLAAQVTLTAWHSVPAWNKKGALRFEIDSAYNKGPYFVRLDGPKGMLDSIAEFKGVSRSYEGLDTGQYCLVVKCCATCTAEVCVEIMVCEAVMVGDVSVLWTREKTLPELDSSAILLACRETETDGKDLCSAVFSLYTPVEIPRERVQTMIEKVMDTLRKIKFEDNQEYLETQFDAWIPDEFEMLVRFDTAGEILWVYSGW